jgi:hypothetical protein
VVVDFDGEGFIFNIEKVEMKPIDPKNKFTKKTFLCEKCANQFVTEVISNSTVVCSKCAATRVQEVTKEEEKKEEAPPLVNSQKTDQGQALPLKKEETVPPVTGMAAA